MLPAHLFKVIRGGGMFLFLVICLGLLLRLFHIDAPLASDELTTVSIWAQMPFLSIPENYQYPNNHIFLTLILNIILKVFGVDPFFLRLPVLLCGILSLLLGYAMTKRITGNHVVALGATLLLTISTNHIYYSTNARGYMLILLFAQWIIYWTVVVFYNSDTRTWGRPPTRLPIKNLFFLLMLCLMGTWTLPTFVFFEGSLLVFFGCLLLWEISENRRLQMSAYAQIMLTVLIAVAGFWVQYFILISPEMLEIARTRAPLTPVSEFIPGIWNHWNHPFESATPLLILLWLAGWRALYQKNKVIYALFIALILVPPVFLLLAHTIGLLKQLPGPRVFLYMQPYFFIGVALGGYEILATVHQFLKNQFRRKRFTFAPLPVIYFLCFLPAGYHAGHELSETIYPERTNREPFHEIHRFIKNSGPHDLFLASNQIHVEFFLYGAEEMRSRVESIIDSGQLGIVYFIGSTLKGRSDIELIGEGENRIYRFTNYPVIGAQDASQPFTLPARVMEEVMQAGNLTIYKIRQNRIHKVTALNTPEDISRWNFMGEPQKIAVETIQTKTKEHWGLRFQKNFTMVSPPLKNFTSGLPVMTLKFLVASNSDQPPALYLNAVNQEGNLKVSPTWLANAWTLDHPYGAKIYSKPWRPWIFISTGVSTQEVIQTNLPDQDTPNILWGFRSYAITAPKSEL
jgi:hypothetical protein